MLFMYCVDMTNFYVGKNLDNLTLKYIYLLTY